MSRYNPQYHREWYLKNRQRRLDQYKVRRAKFRYIVDAKKSVPCADCGQQYPPYVMDFDHLGDKLFNISAAHSSPTQKVLNEIEKCEVVCSNCHRERTYRRASLV